MLDSGYETGNSAAMESRQDAYGAVYGVDDEAENDTVGAPAKHSITAYGADLSVESLCRMQESGEIIVPSFQRSFVWTLRQSSRFIESLLLDWPVPGIFLASDAESDKLLVIDGQQRLKSLLFFRQGVFDHPNNREAVPFALTGVNPEFDGATYSDLCTRDKENLDSYLFHATVIGNSYPEKDDTSIYHIFERLNTGGVPLQPQEVRAALYHGKLMDAIREINQHPSWRKIYGDIDVHQKDQELILRFLAFAFPDNEYQSPLREYLNRFASDWRNPPDSVLEKYTSTFKRVSDLWWDALGDNAFRPNRKLNAAVFDSMAVGLAKRIGLYDSPYPTEIAKAYHELIQDPDYLEAAKQWTSSESAVKMRLEKVINRLARA